ncbi:hypothetical protein [Marinoscillum furvescens]|uniref:Uncharacterized protein n=1 Tax=Marinoscillum furvescens DSM 4134 TaxID=1122208 RepID=A0A3D9KWE8_MARFU|nr:hypothetical protein [Marinoscillum furvescens]RED91135.1 hypothetical protein C7460_1592 [Marinoscillum furvescens DSM 4134]
MRKQIIFLIVTFSLTASELLAQEKIIEIKIGGLSSKDFSSDPEYNTSKSLLSFPMGGVYFYSKTNDNYWVTYGLEYQKLGNVYNYYTGFNNERSIPSVLSV